MVLYTGLSFFVAIVYSLCKTSPMNMLKFFVNKKYELTKEAKSNF